MFHDCGREMHMTTYSPSEEENENLIALECVVGKNWVITAHDHPLEVLHKSSPIGCQARATRCAQWACVPRHAAGMGARRLLRSVRAGPRPFHTFRRPCPLR